MKQTQFFLIYLLSSLVLDCLLHFYSIANASNFVIGLEINRSVITKSYEIGVDFNNQEFN